MIELYKGDCLEIMKEMLSESVDLTVTSPPYDNLREYNGNISQWNKNKWEGLIAELFRITKQGGVVVWVVGDATIKRSETGTSFKQALYAKEIGFNLHDTMIYQKINYVPLTHNRYEQSFEYMFIFSKGKPNTFNPKMVDCKGNGNVEKYGAKRRQNHGKKHSMRLYDKTTFKVTKDKKIHSNIFSYTIGKEKTGHPAPFPEQLANDHILSWSGENDTIFDPMMGSGTTGKMAALNNRNFIGIEIDETYFRIAEERINQVKNNQQLKMKGV